MSRNHGRIAPSRLALLVAAGLIAAPPALANEAIAAGATRTTAVTASPAVGVTFTVDVDGTLRGSSATAINSIVVQGSGAGPVVIRNDGRIQGRFNLPAATGDITVLNNTGADPMTQGWHTSGVTTFGAGDDRIENGADGVIATSGSTTFNFGAGSNSFANAGRLIVDRQSGAGTLTLTGLGSFENSGVILLGSVFNAGGAAGQESDGQTNDRLVAQGVDFNGSAGSRIVMDVALGAATQAGCAAATVADCVDFTGGTTTGTTLLTLNNTGFGGGVLNEGITLVAGSTEAGAFVLDPASNGYRNTLGGAVQNGLAAYRLVYDADGQRHMLVGTLADEAFQPATFAALAQETWRATTGGLLERQADLRAAPGGLQSGNGLWGRVGGGVSERDVSSSFQGGAYDVGHKQKTAHLIAGADLLSASSQDSAWVVGAMLGFVRSEAEYDLTPTELISSGFTGGLYASYLAGPLFVDAVVNANRLDLRTDLPNLEFDTGVKLTQEVESLGAQVEAGWRVPLSEGLFVEPLAGVSYVETNIEDVDLPGGAGSFGFDDSYKSVRYGAGLRLGMDAQLMGLAAGYSLTGRYWNESEGESAVSVRMPDDAVFELADDFGGDFGELAAAVNLHSADGGLSGFVSLGGKFADDYSAVTGSAGVRLRW